MKPAIPAETIEFKNGTVEVEDIAAIHDLRNGLYDVILSNDTYSGVSLSVGKGSTAYDAVEALYRWRAYTWVEEDDEAYTVYANHYRTLAVLDEEMTQNGYAYTYRIGGAENWIKIFKNQGKSLNAMDRELWMSDYVDPYRDVEDDE